MSIYAAPIVDDESRELWAGLAEGELRLPVCTACGRAHFYPRILCPHCGGTDLTWEPMSGAGVVYSYTVSHRLDADRVPFQQVLALVDLAEGPRMLVELRGEGLDHLAVGDAVQIHPEGEPALPFFRRAGQ